MKDRLPEHIEPLRLARSGRVLQGVLPLSRMARLMDSIDADTGGDVEVELSFAINDRHVPCVRGHLRTAVGLQCQRCMQEMSWPVDNQFELLIVESEAEAEQLGEECEVLLLDEQLISLSDLVEDEILLSLPIVPKHQAGTACADNARSSEAVEEIAEQAVSPAAGTATENQARKNPFAVLAELKNRKD
ncbi:YceD family protein [Sulfuriflexus mobilis]|uniref:YceD family protein n=1 Tax=Sulfuriflexus mobilis TaxID=1811807 RepID=UPI00155991FB|nr:YceD family protein [Sulfuriflexus mobilis]